MTTPKDFPLFLHQTGQWAKKVRGKMRYFGKDKDAALKRYIAERDYLYAGLTPPTRVTDGASVSELCNVYFHRCTHMQSVGKFSQRHVDSIRASLAKFVAIVGGDTLLEALTPLDFGRVKFELFTPEPKREDGKAGRTRDIEQLSAVTVDNHIGRIVAMINWCRDQKLIKDIDLGELAKSSKADKRKQRAATGKRNLSASVVRSIIDEANKRFKPLVLLGINGGMGNTDLANIEFDDITDLHDDVVWFDSTRRKSGAHRRFPLWPETVEAINEYLPIRGRPTGRDAVKAMFLTRNGHRWVRVEPQKHTDSISCVFKYTRKALELDGVGFYDLRRTFATVAAGALDDEATRLIMGHVTDDRDVLNAVYVQSVDDERLLKVSNHVRSWLFG